MQVVIGAQVLMLVLLHLRHRVEGRERRRQHVSVLYVEEAEILLAGELQHFRDWRRRRHGHFGAVAGRVAVLRHCLGRRRGCW